MDELVEAPSGIGQSHPLGLGGEDHPGGPSSRPAMEFRGGVQLEGRAHTPRELDHLRLAQRQLTLTQGDAAVRDQFGEW